MTMSNPSSLSFASDDECQGFHMFMLSYAEKLSMNIGWRAYADVAFQFSHTDPVIRHCIAALGSMLREALPEYTNPSDSSRHRRVALKQYHTAIVTLRRQLSEQVNPSVEVTMLACTLFIFCDFLMKDDLAAYAHLQRGIAVARSSLKDGGSSYASLSWNDITIPPSDGQSQLQHGLICVLALMDFFGSFFLDVRSREPPLMKPYNNYLGGQYPAEFDSLVQAEHKMNWQLMGGSRQFFRSLAVQDYHDPIETSQKREALLTDLDAWKTTFENLQLSSSASWTATDWRDAIGQKANYNILRLCLLAVQDDGTEDYSSLTDGFRDLLAEALPGKQLALSTEPKTDPMIFFLGIISPIYLTAIHCCDAEVRRAAIYMLENDPWKDGAWDSVAMARIARRKIREKSLSL